MALLINSLISSGDVNLITNDSLKYLVADWTNTEAIFERVELPSFEVHRRFSEYLDKRFPEMRNQFHNKSSENLRNRFEKIIGDVEYGNRLIIVQKHFEDEIRVGQKITTYIDGTIYLIDQEIEKLE